jgi:hypothetical protein
MDGHMFIAAGSWPSRGRALEPRVPISNISAALSARAGRSTKAHSVGMVIRGLSYERILLGAGGIWIEGIHTHTFNLIVSLGAAGLHCGETTRTVLPMNSLFVIVPYKYEGMWVFDDPRVGLSREPFIAGIDTMIDKLVAKLPDAERGFRAIFSAAPFPGHTESLDWRREESGGNWYYNDHFKMEGWLCPALFNYFAAAPKTIYVQVEPKS